MMRHVKVSTPAFLTLLLILPFSSGSWLDELSANNQNKEWNGLRANNQNNEWNGNWFPMPPNQKVDKNPTVTLEQLHDAKHGIKMGVASSDCDDAETRLEVDWLDDPTNYTCFEDKRFYLPDENLRPIFSQDHIPKGYSAPHKCMSEAIAYSHYIPTFGAHRPLWARYGEYKFLPKQRWLHNLEHGAIVMLYHPCANPYEVNYLRNIVTNCLYRHVITSYNLLTPERPLALVSWGRRLEMSKVDLKIAMSFITTFAKHGPERTRKDGQYDYGLVRPSEPPVDKSDSIVCSKLQQEEMK